MRSSMTLMTAPAQLLIQPQVSMGTGASNGCYSHAMTLPINDWLFHLEGGTMPPYCLLYLLPFISIGVNCLCISIVFEHTQSRNKFFDLHSQTCHQALSEWIFSRFRKHRLLLGVAWYMHSYRTVTVRTSRFGAWGLTTNEQIQAIHPIQKGAPAVMQRCLITASRRTENDRSCALENKVS